LEAKNCGMQKWRFMYVGLFFCSFLCVSLDNEYSRAADNLGFFLPDQGFVCAGCQG
jgi:hypothetical protein